MITAQRAVDTDLAQIDKLCQLARDETLKKRGGSAFATTEPFSAGGSPQMLESEQFVGRIDTAIVGVAVIERHGTRGLVSNLFVHPEARGVGVGHALLGEIVAQAQAWNCEAIDSYALPGDRETKNFFESHAMKSRLLIVSHDLAPTEAP